MFRNYYTLALTLFTIFVHSQHITFQPNVNYKANELEQILDHKMNQLVLQSKDKQIQSVVIFNDDFSESIYVNSNKTNIDLNLLPIGSFIIKAKIDTKWIVMSLEKKSLIRTASFDYSKSEVKEYESIVNDNVEDAAKKTTLYYWVVSESNSNFGSTKIMRLEYKEDIDKLIAKITLELKSDIGKKNKLVIYEVFDKSEFMTNQLRNSEYYKSETSTIFNVEPVYAYNN